ncbi:ECF-type sigma factor [Planctomycetaceae bacterium SH139]
MTDRQVAACLERNMTASGKSPDDSVTRLLSSLPERQDELYDLVYAHLKMIARSRLRWDDRRNAIDTTALVNEAYLRLAKQQCEWRDRRHFFGVAAEAMRRILIDAARMRLREKRGGGTVVRSLSGNPIFEQENWEEGMLELHVALEELEKHSAELYEVVQLRYFSGLSVKQCAEVLSVSPSTVERRWRFARVWLQTKISGNR